MVASCGGDSPTFAERANTLCRNAQSVELPDRSEARTSAELARMDAEIKRLDREALAAFEALDPPAGREETVQEWLRRLRRQLHASWELLDATRKGVETDAAARVDAENAALTRLARELGATACIGPASHTVYTDG